MEQIIIQLTKNNIQFEIDCIPKYKSIIIKINDFYKILLEDGDIFFSIRDTKSPKNINDFIKLYLLSL